MIGISYVRCIEDREGFTLGNIYKVDNDGIRDDTNFKWHSKNGSESYFSKVTVLHIPVSKHKIIYMVLDKLHIKYDKQYKAIEIYKDISFNGCLFISTKIQNIYDNINLLYENNLFQLHCCKVKMMVDSIDTYIKMYDNEMIDDKGIDNVYDILCKYNEFLDMENTYVKNKNNKNDEDLKNKSGEVLNDILAEQNKKLDIWIKDLKEFNK